MTHKPGNTNTPIKIGIIGIGAMGKGLLYQSYITPGIDCVAVCDSTVDRCMKALKLWELDFSSTAN